MMKNADFIFSLAAVAGLVTHAIGSFDTVWPFTSSGGGEEGGSIFWTSERLNQSGEGHERPFCME